MKSSRILASLTVGVSICIACAAPAASPTDSVIQRYNFGVAMIGAAPIVHVFRITDMQKQPITVERISTGCRCTTAFIGAESPEELPVTLKPDEGALVHVQVDTGDLAPGSADKYAYVYLKGRSVPSYTLELSGDIHLPAPHV